ncbi:esterase [Fulvivirga sp. RKSG066]|uniref:esterase n=1 Tax=Fulvivirga aurantia TaxID=2529383 RepID=UPI0012BD679C|nr:esterase [Fulvivirga aurantia]MTI23159.1 esterase [Fulvivirga aurantia]
MNYKFNHIELQAPDDQPLELIHATSKRNPWKGPLLLVHGAGVRFNIFNPPTSQNIIIYALVQGYDVWLLNWRASIDLEPNEWDLDKAAQDYPVAVQKIVELSGYDEIKAIIHCQGSTSFMVSVMLGLLQQVKVIVSNAVSLHPVVPDYSVFKMKAYVPIVKNFFTYLNPQWGRHAPDFKSKLLKLIVFLFHREPDTMVGKFVSFTYGAGWPALWELDNLNEETLNWIQDEFAEVPLTFFLHMKKCLKAGHLVSNDENEISYVNKPYNQPARIALFAGAENKCFLAKSQQRTFDYLEKSQPGRHSLHIIENYSHLDIFFGKNAHEDVFPIMFDELNKS